MIYRKGTEVKIGWIRQIWFCVKPTHYHLLEAIKIGLFENRWLKIWEIWLDQYIMKPIIQRLEVEITFDWIGDWVRVWGYRNVLRRNWRIQRRNASCLIELGLNRTSFGWIDWAPFTFPKLTDLNEALTELNSIFRFQVMIAFSALVLTIHFRLQSSFLCAHALESFLVGWPISLKASQFALDS